MKQEQAQTTGAELRATREMLGLTGDHLAKMLGINPRTIRSWEQGRDPIPARFGPELAELKESTREAVTQMVAGIQGQDAPILTTYRNDAEYQAANPDTPWTAAWHRQVCARAADQTGARIDYANAEDEDEKREA